MEKLKLFMIMLVLGGLGLVGCDDNDPEGPEISATTFVAGSEPGTAELRVPDGTEVVYRFDIKSAAPIATIDVWYRSGLGANMDAPMEEKTIDLSAELNVYNEYVVSDTLILSEDCSYSVYVEDVNRNFSSARVNLFMDVTKYNVELTDGMPAATSKTFLCLETGRTFFVPVSYTHLTLPTPISPTIPRESTSDLPIPRAMTTRPVWFLSTSITRPVITRWWSTI